MHISPRRLAAAGAAAALAGVAAACGSAQAAPGYVTEEEYTELAERVDRLEDAVIGEYSADAAADSHDGEAGTDSHGEESHGEATADTSHEEEEAHAAGPHWTYAEAASWGELGEEYAACGTGHEQSPIDLTRPVLSDQAEPKGSWHAAPATITDNGHTVQIDVPDGGTLVVDDHEYTLVQFHFHGPSEHTIDGEHAPVEVHFVHADAEGRLAVLGVLVAEGEAHAGYEQVLAELPAEGEKLELGDVDVSTLMPKRMLAYRYPGSLTTPPCSEGVAWSVLAWPVTWSAAQIEHLTAHFHEANNRPVQPMHERELNYAVGA